MPDESALKAIRWVSDYAVGVPDIDKEHQWLFSLVEELRVAMRAGHAAEILDSMLKKLLDYTEYHFSHEEELMARIGYPYYQDHCRQHEILRTKLFRLRDCQTSPADRIMPELMNVLVDWLKCHTTTSDRRIGSYMRKRGLVP